MGLRSWLMAAGLWVGIVAAVAVATWSVIDSAGGQVLADPSYDSGTSVPGAAPGELITALPPTKRSETRKDDARPRPTRQPAATPTSESTATPALPVPAATTPSRSSSSAPRSVTRTWQGGAGSVSVRCLGTRISLESASPGDGWRLEVEQRGPEEVKVQFERGETDGEDSGGEEREGELKARCRGGEPRFEADS